MCRRETAAKTKTISVMRKILLAALLTAITVQPLLAQGMMVYKGEDYQYYTTSDVDSLVFVNEDPAGNAADGRNDGFYKKAGNLGDGDVWVLTRNGVKNDKRLVFSGNVSSFTSLTLGHGHGNGDYAMYGLTAGQWQSSRVVIDATNITVHYQLNSEYTAVYAHGLTIENNIQVEIKKGLTNTATIKLLSNGKCFEQKVTWHGDQGDVFIRSEGAFTDCVASWTCSKLKGGTWLFGDSFFSLTSEESWTKYLIDDGYTNFVLIAWSGAGCSAQITCLQNLLTVAKPATVVWCVGMNNTDKDAVNATWYAAYEKLKAICRDNNITLILSTLPNAFRSIGGLSSSMHDYKNEIIRTSGYRYIDFSKAVGADNEGMWYQGLKKNADVHPTKEGAKVLYHRAICDAPELMQ